MNIYITTYHNATWKSKYGRLLEELIENVAYPKYYQELMVMLGAPEHILNSDKEWQHVYVKYPFTMNFVRMKGSASSGSSGKNGFCYFTKLLKPVLEEAYDTKVEIKYDEKNMLYSSVFSDFLFLECMSEESIKDIDWSQFTFDNYPSDIYTPQLIIQFTENRYLFTYRLKYDENYETFAAIIDFNGEFPLVERMTVKQWDVYRDGGTTKAVLIDTANREHNVYVPTAFKPIEERIPTYDDKEYVLLDKQHCETLYYNDICKKCADALGIQLFKEMERR